MLLKSLFFLLGVVVLQAFPELPSRYWCVLLAPILAAMIWRRRLSVVAMALLGFLWALGYAHWVLAVQLPPQWEGQDLHVEGQVIALPQQRGRVLRFLFEIDHWLDQGTESLPAMRVRLGWYAAHAPLKAGQRWRLTVRLKRPHGFRNPGGFDYEAWLFQQKIRATGYVRDQQPNALLQAAQPWSLAHWRAGIGQRLDEQLRERSSAPFLKALALGERKDIRPEQWEILRRTGTNHLVAISGLHIGMVVLLVFALWRRAWSCSDRLLALWPAPKAAMLGAVVAATGYAALAGFSLPTQRALLMLLVLAGAQLLQREPRYGHGLAVAMLLILLLDPLAVLSLGFWLSFAAVAFLLYALSGRLLAGSWWLSLLRVQMVVSLGLAPMLIAQFQQVSLLAPVVNLFAVPWVTVTVVPVTLLATLALPWPALSSALFYLADKAMTLLWWALEWVAQLPLSQWTQGQPPSWSLALAALGVLLLLAPRGLPGRLLGILLLLPMLLWRSAPPQAGELYFTLLDVGQGLAAVVQTQKHVLVYDTGPSFSRSFDAGGAVLVPFLRSQGIAHIDRLVLSHGDNDHTGGLASLLQAIPAEQVLTSVPAHRRLRDFSPVPCVAGQHWQWDGVQFRFLHPPLDKRWKGNNGSCVLRIETSNKVLLLPGDLERSGEKALLRGTTAWLAADVLVVPHHGSASSSTDAFVAAVAPSYALFPVGYRNRWQFPRPQVVARYTQQGAYLLDTAQHGAIRLELGSTPLLPAERYRQNHRRYWHDP